MERLNRLTVKYDILTPEEIAEWNRLCVEAEVAILEKRAAEYLATRQK